MWISFKGVDVVGALVISLTTVHPEMPWRQNEVTKTPLDSALLVLNRRNHAGAAWFAYTDAHLTN